VGEYVDGTFAFLGDDGASCGTAPVMNAVMLTASSASRRWSQRSSCSAASPAVSRSPTVCVGSRAGRDRDR